MGWADNTPTARIIPFVFAFGLTFQVVTIIKCEVV
jgi:hypothetical protein